MKELQFRDLFDSVIQKRRVLIIFIISMVLFTLLLSYIFPSFFKAKLTFFMPLNQSNIGFALPATSQVTDKVMPLQSSDMMKGLREIMLSSAVKNKALERATAAGNPIQLKGLKIDCASTGIFTISSINKSPKLAYSSTLYYYEALISLFQELASRNVGRIRQFLIEEINNIVMNRERAEEQLLEFKTRNTIVSMDQETTHLVSKGDKLEVDIIDTRVKIEETAEKLGYLAEELSNLAAPISSESVGQSPVIVNLRNNLASVRVDLARLKEIFTDRHPEIIEKKSMITELEDAIREELSKIIRVKTESLSPIYDSLRKDFIYLHVEQTNMEARLESLQQQLDEVRHILREQPRIQLELSQLEREVVRYEQMHNNLEGKLEEANLQLAKELVIFETIDDVEVPDNPTYPDPLTNAIVAFIFSIILGLIYCILLQFSESRQKLKLSEMVFLNKEDFQTILDREE